MKAPEQLNTRKLFSLSLKNLEAARVQWKGNILGTHREGNIWHNVGEHSVVQTAGCIVLAEQIGLPEAPRKNLEFAALVHDWDKIHQTTGLRKINQQVESGEIDEEEGGKRKYDFFEESERHSQDGLRKMGVSEEVIRIASSDGHPALPGMMDPITSLEEKILHYVGSITSESDIVALDARIDALEKNPRYKMMNEYGRQVPWTNDKTLYEVQRNVGHQIEQELVDKLLQTGKLSEGWKAVLSEDPTQLPQFIREKITEKYSV